MIKCFALLTTPPPWCDQGPRAEAVTARHQRGQSGVPYTGPVRGMSLGDIYSLAALAPLALLFGCAVQPAYQRPTLILPTAWENGGTGHLTPLDAAPPGRGQWWKALRDPAVDSLVAAALSSNPTLAEAAARVDQARAALSGDRAQRLPQLDLAASASRQQTGGALGGAVGSTLQANAASLSPRLSWEVDLWGRAREAARADSRRLEARNADAEDARLSIAAQITDNVLALRACNSSLSIRDGEIASRTTELQITRKRLAFGNIAPVDVANGESDLAAAETDRITLQEQCLRYGDALVALSGQVASFIRVALPVPAIAQSTQDLAALMPTVPAVEPALPACVLLAHPSVVAGEREAAARWSEIGMARAEQRPRLDLAAILSGQWLSALGSTGRFVTWSLGPNLSMPLFDGGAGTAKVRLAQARYRESVAALDATVRGAARDIEDALAAQQSAALRVATSGQAVASARYTLRANEARWRAGAISLFELEDSRRQARTAQDSAVAAARDRARSWVELVRSSGSAFGISDADAVTGRSSGTVCAEASIYPTSRLG